MVVFRNRCTSTSRLTTSIGPKLSGWPLFENVVDNICADKDVKMDFDAGREADTGAFLDEPAADNSCVGKYGDRRLTVLTGHSNLGEILQRREKQRHFRCGAGGSLDEGTTLCVVCWAVPGIQLGPADRDNPPSRLAVSVAGMAADADFVSIGTGLTMG
jgi:hypothetical protein